MGGRTALVEVDDQRAIAGAMRDRAAEEDLVDAEFAMMDMPPRQVENALKILRHQDLLVDEAVAEAGGIAADLPPDDDVEFFPCRITPLTIAQPLRDKPAAHAANLHHRGAHGSMEGPGGTE